ncbi:hypothetical protein [Serratia fonticola]|uniref:Uncharacterized protein n=1 Tax=Serratia fonticola TaxID=47917 RepID=A0AAW3WT65_SERFO|nr:hypothetical protein [Serratia fonticola]MBC3213398.1 hypothetical protein [Serratia fonticola]NYA14257.1 hypothetical protein [Serratia fonticola]NYA33899.1 hypothetical protein [Serratia fonticola]
MHNDYRTRLTVLSDKLTDVVLDEADPDNWPGAGKEPTKHTKQERGDRYWCKKNAAASLTLLVKVHSLIGMHTRGGVPKDGEEPDDEAFKLGQQVASAEKAAMAVLERLQNKKK